MKNIYLLITLLFVTLQVNAKEMVMCPAIYQPVCGYININDEEQRATFLKYKTFGNKCMLNNSEYTYSHDGECENYKLTPNQPQLPEIKTDRI